MTTQSGKLTAAQRRVLEGVARGNEFFESGPTLRVLRRLRADGLIERHITSLVAYDTITTSGRQALTVKR